MALVEKLDETLGVKLASSQLRQLRGVAEAAGTTPSELVRHLIEQHLQVEHARYLAYHSTFADAS